MSDENISDYKLQLSAWKDKKKRLKTAYETIAEKRKAYGDKCRRITNILDNAKWKGETEKRCESLIKEIHAEFNNENYRIKDNQDRIEKLYKNAKTKVDNYEGKIASYRTYETGSEDLIK